MPNGIVGLAIVAIIAMVLLGIFGNKGGQPAPIPTPTPYSTNDPLWIVNHCDIPAVAAAHNILC